MHRRAVLSLFGVLILGGCQANSNTESLEQESQSDSIDIAEVVSITNDPAFEPEIVEIEEGETVRWKNETSMLPTVTAYEDEIPEDGAYFASGGYSSEPFATMIYPFGGALDHGEFFDHTFHTAGKYPYYSISPEHPRITGTIIVEN